MYMTKLAVYSQGDLFISLNHCFLQLLGACDPLVFALRIPRKTNKARHLHCSHNVAEVHLAHWVIDSALLLRLGFVVMIHVVQGVII